MGLQASGLSTINKTTQALTLIKQDIGQKIYINKRTQQQYMLISRLINEGDESIQQSLIKRKSLQSQYIPSLLHYGKETQNYCSNITTMHILFKHPSKSLAEEQVHRLQAHQWFLQGQILMISFCILNALQEYRKLYDNYQIVINQNTIFIQICGNIILSDSDSYKDKPLKRLSLRRISMQRFRMAQRAAMTQLSMVLERLMNEKDKIKDYSDRLGRFTNLLRKGQFNSYEQAIIYLNDIKDKDRTSSKRRSKNTTTIQQISNISSSSNSTPIQQLIKISDVRQPLAQIKLNNNHIPKKIQFISTKKRQTKLKTFKTQFQNKKQQAFAQQKFEHIFQEEGLTLRIDEISSIHQRNSNRLTQQDDAQPLPIFYDNYLIQDSLSSMQSLQLPTNKIELFNNNQPLKLQQLVLNQKGIIYEESADELQSMASQRTFRRKNIQYYNQ